MKKHLFYLGFLNKTSKVFFVIFLLFILSFFCINVSAQSDQELADMYAPVLYFEKEETCYPVDAELFVENSVLYAQDDPTPLEIDSNPSPDSLDNYNTDFYKYYYLDKIDGVIKNSPKTVYYRVYRSSTGTTVVQYWMFYFFNKGELNQHEGDWEMVQVVLPSSGSKWVAYSQHHSGQWATWDQVERDGNHVQVYVSRGSHANYLRSYSGKLGIASDIVNDNGKILKPSSYNLVDITTKDWVEFRGLWGDLGDGGVDGTVSSSILGQAGPNGPKYREDGNMWDDPVSWGKNLPQANDMMFLAEWFLHNFVMIFLIITAIIVAIMCVFIYRRHKKYGLGPRFLSMLYIDGLNLKSIGNILCFVGIIIAFIGLFLPWYSVSYDFSGNQNLQGLETEGWQELMSFDGIHGVQLIIPSENGPMPVGNFVFPLSLIIAVSLVLLFIASIGIIRSTRLGFKYIGKGIRVLTPVLLIIIVIVALGSLIPEQSTSDDLEGASMGDILGSISGSPFGGDESYTFNYEDEDAGTSEQANLNLKWGLGLGAILLLVASIILIVSGLFEIFAKTMFFTPKAPIKKSRKQKKKEKKQNQQQMPPQNQSIPPQQLPQTQPMQEQQQPTYQQNTTQPPIPPTTDNQQQTKEPPETQNKPVIDEVNFCPECGSKIGKGAIFCPECGKKIK